METDEAIVRVEAARALAAAALVAFEHAAECGRPLTQLQQIDVVANSIMSYNSMLTELSGLTMDDLIGHSRRVPLATGVVTVEVDITAETSAELHETMTALCQEFNVNTREVERHGPGGGWPAIEIEGLRENVRAALLDLNYDPDDVMGA